MKKFLGILALLVLAVAIFVSLPKETGASKNVFDKGTPDEIEKAKQKSLDVMRNKAAERGIGNADELKVKKVNIDELKMAHTRFQQTVNDVPVWEGEAIVHLDSDGELRSVTDDLKGAVSVNTQPNFSGKDALKIAKSFYKGSKYITEEPKVELWVYRGEKRDHLTYRVEMPRLDGTEETAIPVIFVDAQTGEKVFEYNNLHTGAGDSLYSGANVTIDTSRSGSTYYMEDTVRKMGTFNMNNTGNTLFGTGGKQSPYTGTDDIWKASIEKAGVDAHIGAAMTFDYYKTAHGRNGIDGNGGPGTTAAGAGGTISLITSRVHFGKRYNNAFWHNNQMTYGDGDGSQFSPLVTLDIAGHEMTHGVTQFTADLTYSNESGALNESMSDVFGAMVELYADKGVVSADTWKIGEDAYTPSRGGDALRYMDNPHLAGNGGYTADDDPCHYAERYKGTSDSGGVHINSGIANHAFYLAAVGGTHRHSGVVVTGIGTTDAARIWYHALVNNMTSGTTFDGARLAMLKSAEALFQAQGGTESQQYKTVQQAWCAVGVCGG
ncbi:MAG TPA: M4 family metallopeptidase [Pyrinomonadaceae bacterium]